MESLEKDLKALEKVVDHLESGDLSLNKALGEYEKGVNLTASCQKTLEKAEQTVKILMDGKTNDFNTDNT